MKEKGTRRPRRADVEIQFDDCGPLMPGCSMWWITPLNERGLEFIEPIDAMMNNPSEDVWEPRGVSGHTVGDLLEAAGRNGILVIEAPPIFITYEEESA